MIFMFCRQYSHAVTQVFMAYWNNAECIGTQKINSGKMWEVARAKTMQLR